MKMITKSDGRLAEAQKYHTLYLANLESELRRYLTAPQGLVGLVAKARIDSDRIQMVMDMTEEE